MTPVLAGERIGLRRGDQPVLAGLDVSAAAGEVVAVTGPSGSGKTSLLLVLAGLLEPDSGTVAISGQAMWPASRRERAAVRLASVGMVMQFAELLPELTVEENVVLPLLLRGARRPTVAGALERVGLADRGAAKPAELSGGERQRVAIARALVAEPAVLLADEPTGSLDAEMSAIVGELLLVESRRTGCCTLVATHDVDLAGSCDRVHRLVRGALCPT